MADVRLFAKAMRKLFFCHIPKTGGTSLRSALEAQCRPWEILPDQYMIARLGGLYPEPSVWVPSVGPAIKLIRGHYHLAVGKLLGPDTEFATIVREPVSRVVSHISHSIRHFGLTAEIVRKMLDQGVVPLIDNVQCRYLSGFSTAGTDAAILELNRSFLAGALTDPVVVGLADKAIAATEQCSYIGTTENLLSMASSLNVVMPKQRENETTKRLFDFTDSDLALIRERNMEDMALYQYVKSSTAR